MRSSPTSFAIRVAAVLASSAAMFAAGNASAQQRELLNPLGDRGTLVIDQLSGFRASTIGGIGYATPIGFSTQSLKVDNTGVNGQVNGSTTRHFTSFWIAPSVDYFVIDHLSIGGVIEFTTTSQTQTTTVTVGANQNTTDTTLPTINSFTFLPRIGWMFALTDRFGIWPRLGLGFISQGRSNSLNPVAAQATDTFSGFTMDLDVGLLYRINENWFFKGAPELTFAPGSVSTTITNGGTTNTTSTNAQVFQFAVVGGVGVMWDLL